ncbi:ABC transporter substrate-binding protein [Streptomyces antioxidans]|uniref:ABC transporter substrate-binding protein n=1 Tax=Streptomyces TaxID=1883 RepID=UPI000A5C5765|nr:ABC transporter substrate-binding protein [Streptomyces antioxidans]
MRDQLRFAPAKLAAAATVTAVLLTGCGGSDEGSGAGGGPEKKTITVAGLPLADVAALHIAMDRELFEKEGLNVRVQPVQQSVQALPALAHGQVDIIGGANFVTFLQAREKGTLATRVLAEGARNAPHMMDVLVPADSKIKGPRDLEGKKVAVNILNNIQSLTLNATLAKAGAGRPAYRQVPFPQMGSVLERGQVDAVHAAEPFATALKRELKARTVLDGNAAPVAGLPLSGYVTTDAFIDKYPKTAAAFRRAISAAQAVAAKDRGAVEKALPGYTKIKPEEAAAIGLPDYPATSSAAQLKRLISLMRAQKLLTKDLDPAAVLYQPAE